MPDTAPVPNIVPIPGMNQGTVIAAGSGGSGGDDANAGDGNDKEGAGGGSGGDDASGDNRDAPDYEKYPTCGTESHPVDVVTGRVFTHPITDLALPGPLPFTFQRSYSSKACQQDQGLGYGWAHSLGWFVELTRTRVRVWNEKGVSVSFPIPKIGDQILGDWGWVLRRELTGFAVDANDDVWRYFTVSFDEEKTFKLTAIESRNRNRITLNYTEGRLAEVIDSAGRTVKVTSTKEGLITSLQVKNAEHQGQWIRFARYEYDDRRRLVRVQDADDYAWTYAYDEHNRLVRDTNRSGLSFCFRYDEKDRGIEAWGEYLGKRDPSLADDLPKFLADGHTRAKGIYHRKFDYHADGYTEVTDTTETRRYYGTKKGTLAKAVSGGAVTSSTYDERGFETSKTDAVGATTRWVRDDRGRPLEVIDPLGRRTRIKRDPLGLPIEVVDPAGGVTRASRDHRGNLELVIDPAGASTQYALDERGLITLITNANGATRRNLFDAHGNVLEAVEPNGGHWTMTYDYFGRRLSARDPTGAERRYVYSNRGDLLAIYDPTGAVWRYSYDGERHLTQIVSPLGHATHFIWGGYNSLCGRRDALGHLVRLAYSREGELLAVINELGEVHRLVYDRAGKVVEEETFDGRRLRYRNDATGRVVRAENGTSEITNFVYDLAGQLIEIELPDETKATFEYDQLGWVTKATSTAGEFAFDRDAVGRVVREVQRVAGQEHWVEVSYDLAGAKVSRTTSLGHTERVSRDAMGLRVRTVLDGTQQLDHVNDLFFHEVQRRLPSGGVIESDFDQRGMLVQRVGRAPTAAISPNHGEPEWMGRRDDGITSLTSYQYNPDGELTSKADRARGVTQYEHDPLGQLLAAVPEKARGELFRYDPAGNVSETGQDWEYGRGNRLLRRQTTEYTYDDDGRLVQKRELGSNSDRTWKYGWNGQGLLAWVLTPDNKRVDFSYDPFARRMEKRVWSLRGADWQLDRSTRFVWAGNALAHEISDDVEVSTFLYSDDTFAPLAQSSRGDWLHFVNDRTGKPERLLDSRGNVVGELDATPWGREGLGASTARTGAKTPLRFQGQYADDETGLFYNRFRYYDPDTTRFVSPDPCGPAAGLNQYRYAASPLSGVDPLGLWGPGSAGPTYTPDPTAAPGVNRVSTVTATIRPQDLDTGTATNASSRAAARAQGCSTDDAGHPIANRLGGHGGVGDVFGQNPSVNRGAFRVREGQVYDAVRPGGTSGPNGATAQVTVQYHYANDTDTRPNGVTYNSTVNGVTTSTYHPNPP